MYQCSWLSMLTSLDRSVLFGFPSGLRMHRCYCWSNSGLCHYAISGWDGMKQHPVHSNQQANQSRPQVCYCHSEICQSQEGFSCWSLSLFMKHPIEIIIKKTLLICSHYLTASLEVLWFLLILGHSFKLSSLNNSSCRFISTPGSTATNSLRRGQSLLEVKLGADEEFISVVFLSWSVPNLAPDFKHLWIDRRIVLNTERN